MTVTIVIVLLDIALQQHDECLFGRLICRAVCIECASDKKFSSGEDRLVGLG
jgi:hypothetical protein